MKKLIYILFITLFVFGSCKKDEDEPEVQTPETLQFDEEEIVNELPDALLNSDNEYAQGLVDYIESAVDMSAFYDQLTPPENAHRISTKTGSVQYSWTYMSYGGTDITMYWTYTESSTRNTWLLEIQYGNGTRYPYITAWQDKDGMEGEVRYNFQWACAYQGTDTECTDVYYIYQWNKDSSGNYTFKWYWESEEYDGYFWQYDLAVAADGSGTLDLTCMGNLWYHYVWGADGHGSVVYYVGGNLTYTW